VKGPGSSTDGSPDDPATKEERKEKRAAARPGK
jgi:hypothetical protein